MRGIAAAAAALVLIIGATLPAGQQALAKLPFVANLLEGFAGYGQDVDYSAYKTQVGETTENEFGKLTLNEIIVDTDRLLITSTLEPSGKLKIAEDNVLWMNAKITINGRSDLQENSGGSGSGSDGENGVYTTYQSIPLSEIPDSDQLHIKIEYNQMSWWHSENMPRVPSEPWTFEVETSRAALLAQTHTIEVNRTVDLINGERIMIEKVVSGPISTLVYYDRTLQPDEDSKLWMYGFHLVSDSGEDVQEIEGAWTAEGMGYSRFMDVDLSEKNYSLIPYDGTKGMELGEAIPLNK
ncbi:DUF4179 domain-containing protein [Saccharibacillus endophyticus]|nr:DUF4179 domain-containing protein [Saccharibacillus endophyticus]